MLLGLLEILGLNILLTLSSTEVRTLGAREGQALGRTLPKAQASLTLAGQRLPLVDDPGQ